MPEVELHISALPIHVRTARLVAAAVGRRIGLDAVVLDEVKLAVGEACSRAVSVHHAAGASQPIIVQFRDDDNVLEVAVMDCGPPGARLPSLDQTRISAPEEPAVVEGSIDMATLAPDLGLAMIVGLVDDVSVDDRPESGGTMVTMRWSNSSL